MTEILDLRPPARQVARLLEGVTDARLAAPTPCPEYRVRNLLGHVAGLSVAFRAAGRKDLGPATTAGPGASVPGIDADWRTRMPEQLDELVAAWRLPEAWEGMTQAGGFTFPAADAGRVALNELVVHGWDLARATGQDYACDTTTLEAALALLEPAASEDRGGMFGPVVEVPRDASLLDRVIALSGRDPAWSPPG
ncbi:MAG: TIGR03086 family metal-binding protein [Actinomadura sp.]